MEKYIRAEMDVTVFEAEDILTGSNDTPFTPFSLDDEEFLLVGDELVLKSEFCQD